MASPALKVELYQPVAVYRNPLSMGVIETYPLPPPSTVTGWIVAGLIFARWRPDMDYFAEWNATQSRLRTAGFNLSIQGRHAGMLRDFQLYVQPDPRERRPVLVNTLVDVCLILHITAQSTLLDEIRCVLNEPPHIPALGRAEDILKIRRIEPVEVVPYAPEEEYCEVPLPTLIPRTHPVARQVHGIPLRLSTWGEWREFVSTDSPSPRRQGRRTRPPRRYREFIWEDFLYVEYGYLENPPPLLRDTEGDFVWWSMPSTPENPSGNMLISF